MAARGEALIYEIQVNSKGASQELKDFDKSVQQLNKSTQAVGKTFDFFKGILAGYLSFQGAKAFLELADAMQETQVRLTSLTGSMEAAVQVQDALFEVAQKHSIAIKDLSKAYIQLAPVLTEQGKSQREILTFTDNLIASYKLIGQSSSEAAQSIQSLAQAYASGKIDANQLGAVLKTNRELLKAVAKEMGVTEQQLLKMAKSGKVSGEQFFQAVIKAGEEWQKRAKELPTGIDEALTNLGNSFAKLAIQFIPVVEAISKGIIFLSENFEIAAAAVIGIAGALLTATNAWKAFNLAMLANPITLIAAAIAGAAYLIITNWTEVYTFFRILFNVSLPNLLDEFKIKVLEFSQTFIGKVLNDILKEFQNFINKLIGYYNELADKLDWEKISEVKFTVTDNEVTGMIGDINRDIQKRTFLIDKYVDEIEKANIKTKDLLNQKTTVLPVTTTQPGTGLKKVEEIFAEGTVGAAMKDRKKDLEEIELVLKRMGETDPFGGFSLGVQKAINEIPTLTEAFAKMGEDLFKNLTDSLTNFVKTGKLEMKDLFNSIVDGLIQIGIQKAIVAAIGTSEGSGTGLIGIFNELVWSAKGNVFKDGNLTPFAKGGVVSQPTIFPFANGVGLMSEKGAEAIMPLHRDSKGSLGVKSAGQGGSSTQVNVYNNTSDSEVETKESTDPNGMKKIDVYIKTKIKSVFASGEMDRTMSTSFGLSRSGSR